jgi:hypothetical protein
VEENTMAEDEKTVKLTPNAQKRLIALGKSLGISPKDELGPEFKKIYFEDYIQAHKEQHDEEAAQSMTIEVLTARYYQKILRADSQFIIQIEQQSPINISKDKEQYVNLSGFATRLDEKGKVVNPEPLIGRILIKGEDNIKKFGTAKDGEIVKATFGIMNKSNYSFGLFRGGDNLDKIEFNQEPMIDDTEKAPYVEKICPLINVSKVFDYTGQVVAIWGKPVLRSSISQTKNVGVYEIIDDSVDKEFLLKYKALTIFTSRKYINYGPGSHVLFVVEILKPKQAGQLPNANLLMEFPSDMVTPVMKKEQTKAPPESSAPQSADDVSDEEMEETGLELL